jgi:Fatty acid desaturase
LTAAELVRAAAHGSRNTPHDARLVQAALGGAAGAMFAAAAGGAVFFLETVNYIEHYGLARRRLPSGKFERAAVQHSWNANQWFSNAVLLRLQRHTDHHMHAAKPYWRLENIEGAPKLPADYSVMFLLALWPPAWFAVMNPRVHIHRMLCDVQGTAAAPGAVAPVAAA